MKISVSILNSEDKKEMIKILNNTNISYIHMDVMDGQFVPQRTLPYPELKELSSISTKKLDIHLMMNSPEEYIVDAEGRECGVVLLPPVEDV